MTKIDFPEDFDVKRYEADKKLILKAFRALADGFDFTTEKISDRRSFEMINDLDEMSARLSFAALIFKEYAGIVRHHHVYSVSSTMSHGDLPEVVKADLQWLYDAVCKK